MAAKENMTISRADIERIGEAVNKPASTIYRWRTHNPELFQAAYEYALSRNKISSSNN